MPSTSEPQPSSESRIIGKLEGVAESLQASLGRVIDGQLRAELKLDAHAEEDRRVQSGLAEGLGGLRDRVVRLEMGADETEGNGAAILNLEQRMAARESSDKTRAETAAAVRANNAKWAGAAAVIGAAAGSAGTSIWPKVWNTVASVFK